MAFTFASLYTDQVIAANGTKLRPVANGALTLFLAGTNTPATIYTNAAKNIGNNAGAVTTDALGNWQAYLDPANEYELEYGGTRYPKFAVSDAAAEGESDLASHAALTSGVHGVPSGQVIATQEYVLNNAPTGGTKWFTTTGAPSNGVGANGDYAIDTAAGVIYGPKDAGAWPAGFSIKGSTGAAGPAGVLSDTNPVDLGTRAPGVANTGSRSDHVHALPTATQVGAALTAGPFAPLTTGATAAVRFVGGTTSGAPATGAFNTGDRVDSQDGRSHLRTASGWATHGPVTSSSPQDIGNTASVGTATDVARADHVHSNAGLVRSSSVSSANGVAALDGTTKVPIDQLPTGTSATTVALGNDARILNAQSTTGKGAANGYAPLGSSATVPVTNLATGTADATKYLKGDGTWATQATVIKSTTAPTDLTAVWVDIS